MELPEFAGIVGRTTFVVVMLLEAATTASDGLTAVMSNPETKMVKATAHVVARLTVRG